MITDEALMLILTEIKYVLTSVLTVSMFVLNKVVRYKDEVEEITWQSGSSGYGAGSHGSYPNGHLVCISAHELRRPATYPFQRTVLVRYFFVNCVYESNWYTPNRGQKANQCMLADQNLWSSYTFPELKLYDIAIHALILKQMQRLRIEMSMYHIILKH